MSTHELREHVALVTGAGRGIGRAVALCLAKRGASVGLLARTQSELEETAESCRRSGAEALVLPVDVTDPNQVEEALTQLSSKIGAPDLVVVNHGIYDHSRALDKRVDWDRVLDVNLRSSMHLTRRVLPSMLEGPSDKKRKALVYVSSIAARHYYAGAGAYCASKAGLSAFANVVFEEVRNHGIKVVQILPGYVNTPMMAGNHHRVDPEKMVQAEDVADAVCWAVLSPRTCCPIEIVLRPQSSPYRG